MHFSGCSASCAQPQIADIGFRGDVAHVGEHIEEAVDIGLGGSLGPDAAFIDWVGGAVPVTGCPTPWCGWSPLPPASAGTGEPFHNWARRTPDEELRRSIAGGRPVKRYRLREEMNGIAEPPGKVWFWELEAGVIDADRCIQCGTCVAVCPSNSIGVDQDTNLPELVKMCTGCSLCWDFCPRGGLRYEALWPPSTPEEGAELTVADTRSDAADTYWKITGAPPAEGLGAVVERYAVRAAARSDDVQDGGAVTALLVALLAAGEIDGALVSKPSSDPDEPWKGVATIATTPAEVAAASGSFYNQTMALAELDLSPLHAAGQAPPGRGRDALRDRGHPGHAGPALADRGAPGRRGGAHHRPHVHQELRLREPDPDASCASAGASTSDRVSKVDVIRGRMIVEYRDGELAVDEPVKDFHGAALKGCDECADFLGPQRRPLGGQRGLDGRLDQRAGAHRAGPAGLPERPGQARRARPRRPGRPRPPGQPRQADRLSLVQRKFDPDGPMFIDYEEHVRNYAGSDRQPVTIRR